MKPLFTFVIPAYNGENFLPVSIHSFVSQRIEEEELYDRFEILIINDGSKDNTKEKAEIYANKYNKEIRKNFIRVINKENGQYGSVINRGIKEANGKYFKVLDCDDSFNISSLITLIHAVSSIEKKVDVIFTDHTFEKVGTNTKILQSLRKYFDPYKVLDVQKQKFPKDLITMHSIIYRTELLKEISYKQVEGVYYSDSQYSLIPLAHSKKMYYLNIPLYRYYIGRGEQSINLQVMVRNRSHQIIVFDTIFRQTDFSLIKTKEMRNYFILVLKRMIQWQAMLIASDKNLENKRSEIMSIFRIVRNVQPKYASSILNNSLFNVLKITRGYGIITLIRWGIKIYAKFKKNIMADWD